MKAEAEQVVMRHAPQAVKVRTSLIYGLAGDDAQSRFVLDGPRRGQPVSLFVDEYRCPIVVHDLASASSCWRSTNAVLCTSPAPSA